MPIKVPELDDRSYADLVQEGIELIPTHSPQWTNHNAADPGIAILEVFAYITDIFLYRLNRISEASRTKFLKLLTGETSRVRDHDGIEDALAKTILQLREPTRAITRDDFEQIALRATANEPAETQVRRAICFPRRNLDALTEDERHRDRPGHISVVVVGSDPWADAHSVEVMRQKVSAYLEPRRLLTSRVHVRGPKYLDLELRLRIAPSPGGSREAITLAARHELNRFFDPLKGGPDARGWPFGRSVFASDVYRVLDNVAGVDSVGAVEFGAANSARLRRNDRNDVTEVQLRPEELVRLHLSDVAFSHPLRNGRSGVSTG